MLRLPSPDPLPTCSSCLKTVDLRFLEPEEGFEPSTFRLRVGCATTTPLGLAERVGVKAECIEGAWRRARVFAVRGWAGGSGGGGGFRRGRWRRRGRGRPGRRGGCWGRRRGPGGGGGACAGWCRRRG